MKIHISNSAKEALDQLGGYITEHRGKLSFKLFEILEKMMRTFCF